MSPSTVMTSPMTFLVTAAVALVAHHAFRALWTSLPRWGGGTTGRVALLVAALLLAVVLVPHRDAGLLGFVTGGVLLPLLLAKRAPARR